MESDYPALLRRKIIRKRWRVLPNSFHRDQRIEINAFLTVISDASADGDE
jgi:hypothetical protein